MMSYRVYRGKYVGTCVGLLFDLVRVLGVDDGNDIRARRADH